jgi:hypothetical protein
MYVCTLALIWLASYKHQHVKINERSLGHHFSRVWHMLYWGTIKYKNLGSERRAVLLRFTDILWFGRQLLASSSILKIEATCVSETSESAGGTIPQPIQSTVIFMFTYHCYRFWTEPLITAEHEIYVLYHKGF